MFQLTENRTTKMGKAVIMEFSIFDMLLEPLFVLNDQGGIFYLNPAAAELFNTTQKKAKKSKHFLQLVQLEPEFPELMTLNQLNQVLSYRELKYTILSNNHTGYVQMGLNPQRINGNIYWIVHFRDTSLETQLHHKYKTELQNKEAYSKKLEHVHKELEKYSMNLESMVKTRTLELERLNSTFQTLLDSLDQGFFIFNQNGECLPVYSKSCIKLLGTIPTGKRFWDIINVNNENSTKIENWVETLFKSTLPFKDLSNLGPERVYFANNRTISLHYFPIFKQNSQLESVVVMATDKTDLELAERAAEKERAYSKMVINVVRRKKEITHYIFDVQKILEELNDSIADHYKFQMQTALRCLHTIKGGALTFAIYDLAQSCHDAEQMLFEIQKEGLSKGTLNILQGYFNKIRYEFQTFLKSNEILLGNEVIHGQRSVEIPLETISKFLDTLKREYHLQDKIADFEKDIFYVPISQFLEGFEETVQALAQKLGKKLNPIKISGGNTLIHREHYSELFTNLIHQLNNIVNHGIENPILRRFHHKEEYGQIRINVRVEEDNNLNYGQSQLIIEIVDDGQGLDPIKIREKLRSKGIATNLLSDQDVLQFIFKGNLSSKDENQITQVSGRGIGMQAIMYTVTDLGGTVKIESAIMKGTTLFIRVPYFTEQVKLAA